MPNSERSSEQSSTLSQGLVGESPRFRPKTIVPDDVEQLSDTLWQRQAEFPRVTSCWRCEAPLALREVNFDWPVGTYSFHFPYIPAYHCDSCNKTYFPEPVREALASCVERELEIKPPERLPRNPLAVAFSRRYSNNQ